MPEKRSTVSEAEEVELEFKRLQIELMRGQLETANDRKLRLKNDRERQVAEFKKAEAIIANKQRVCQHRKGGRDNRFAKGSDANYSVITNTYPTGEMCISCTRCGKEVWKPKRELKKADPELYAQRLAEFRLWSNFPTDNTPSGSKIFEIAS